MQRKGGFNPQNFFRFFVLQTVTSLIVTGIILVSVFYLTTQHLKQDIRARALEIALLSVESLDVNAHEMIVSEEQHESETYIAAIAPLRRISASNPEVSSVYTLRATNQDNVLTFVLDSLETKDYDEDGVISEDEIGAEVNELYDASDAPALIRGLNTPSADKNVTHDKWGAWISGYVPILDSQGKNVGVLGVDIDARNYWNGINLLFQKLVFVFILGMILSFFVGFLGVFILRRENGLIFSKLEQREVILSSSPLGIAVLDQNKNFQDLNPNFYKLLQLSKLKTTPGASISTLPRDILTSLTPIITKATPSPGASIDISIKDAKDERRVRVNAITLVDENTEHASILLLVQDISAEYKLTQGLLKRSKKAEAQVEELNKLRNEFVHVVSHQLRTPLNAVRWNLETLLTGQSGKLTKLQKQLLEMSYAAEVEVIKRISDMMTAMDIEEGKVRIKKESASILNLFIEEVTKAKEIAKKKKIHIASSTPKEEIKPIKIDVEKIRQSMSQLIDNAIDYSNEESDISIKLSIVDKMVKFEVKDHGIGIPSKEQRRVFGRFFRASNATSLKTDSSGLGLALAKFFVEQHGGEIGFESKSGEGSTFWFTLPLK